MNAKMTGLVSFYFDGYELVLNGTILDAKSIIAIQRLYMAPNHMIGVSPYDGAPARD